MQAGGQRKQRVRLSEKPPLAWRVIAARVLKGWEARELKAEFKSKQIQPSWVDKLEGENAQTFWDRMKDRDRAAVLRVLDASERWLTGQAQPLANAKLDAIAAELEHVTKRLAQLQAEALAAEAEEVGARKRRPPKRKRGESGAE